MCLCFKYSILIQSTDKVGLQYDPRPEVPDSSKTLPILLLKKLVAIVVKLNHERLKKYNQQRIC